MRALQANSLELSETVRWLFAQGNELSLVGVWAFLLACVLTSFVLLRRVGRVALPGAILLCGAAYPFLGSHIYYPVGVLTMLLMALGFALLMAAKVRRAKRPPERPAKIGNVSNACCRRFWRLRKLLGPAKGTSPAVGRSGDKAIIARTSARRSGVTTVRRGRAAA